VAWHSWRLHVIVWKVISIDLSLCVNNCSHPRKKIHSPLKAMFYWGCKDYLMSKNRLFTPGINIHLRWFGQSDKQITVHIWYNASPLTSCHITSHNINYSLKYYIFCHLNQVTNLMFHPQMDMDLCTRCKWIHTLFIVHWHENNAFKTRVIITLLFKNEFIGY